MTYRPFRVFVKFADGGIIIVATGSRIFVPYKKPFSSYVSELPPDLHCFRFSQNTLSWALDAADFGRINFNDVKENDAMIAIAYKKKGLQSFPGDNPHEVLAYFKAWKEAFP